ncbi:restriction endonuclease subunit S [Brevibacillus sp. HB1.1]|uniref:restriction endonuclease subunit S n=1 Tax=Brevibacillus sp. HB1.1 TaxID=2738808 RepID=UPI00157586D5|nr:restriction endonuclease subunit S [Brevibacillus sp. HB1.1]NTU30655.1 restriction endonuclease subunit S [Brevibacillus sp. HB1.1]
MPKYRFEDIAFNITQKRKPTSDDMKTYIGLEHLDSGSLSVTRWGSDVPIKGDKLLMQKGDILFGKRNAYLRRAAIAPHDGLFSAHGMILRPNEKVISRKLFPFFICSDYFFDAAIRISVGSLSPTINWSALKELEFILPHMNKQEKLADLLWAANDTKEAYKRLLYLTDELVKSQFIEMFGDLTRKSNDWSYSPLREHADILAGNPFDSSGYVDNGINICGGLIIMPDRIAWEEAKKWPSTEGLDKYLLQERDIVLAMDRPWISSGFKIAMIKQSELPALLIQRTARIRSKDLNQQYILWVLKSDAFLKHCNITQTTVPHISMGDIKNYNIPIPPISLQNQFADFVQQTDKSKFELKQNIENLETTIKALMLKNFG